MGKTIGDGKYQKYDWLYHELITLGKTEKQVAKEQNLKLRLIVKWTDIHQLGDNNFAKLKTLSSKQISLIKASLLGDGHVSHNMFVVSHCDRQKDYLFWKYNLLKDLCKKPPSYYKEGTANFNGKIYHRSASYRFCTRKIEQIQQLKAIPKIKIIRDLTEFEFAVWMLDDGYRGEYSWELCLGSLNKEEKKELDLKLQQFGLKYKYKVDPRYIRFNCESSRKIDEIITNQIPNELDIVKYKVLERR